MNESSSSQQAFDPYSEWLGIPPNEQPPHHYRLLGIPLFESNPKIIGIASDRQMMYVKGFQHSPNANASQKLLNEISVAAACLMNSQAKALYDQSLSQNDVGTESPSIMATGPIISDSKKTLKMTKRSKQKTSPVVEIVKVVLGGAFGLFLAVMVLSYFWGIDILGIKKPDIASDSNVNKVTKEDQPALIAKNEPVKARPANQVNTKIIRKSLPESTDSVPQVKESAPTAEIQEAKQVEATKIDPLPVGSIWEGMGIQTEGPGSGDESKVMVTITKRSGDGFSGMFHWTNTRSLASGERPISGKLIGEKITWEGTVGKMVGNEIVADWEDGQYKGTEKLTKK